MTTTRMLRAQVLHPVLLERSPSATGGGYMLGLASLVEAPRGQARGRFDVVIAADGMHSATRDLVCDSQEVETFETGWAGWVVWIEPDPATADLYAETWGRGFFIGRYPVRGRTGVFVGGPHTEIAAGIGPFLTQVRSRLRVIDPETDRALAAIGASDATYEWQFNDVRSGRWARGRVVLLGDPAAGFLPTAGIGAAMAIESAAVLATGLAASSRGEIHRALAAYEREQRPRVIAAHENSRQFAQLMFRKGRVACAARDLALRGASLSVPA